MKKFSFRLERVLQYRKVIKDDKMRELLERNNELLIEDTKLKNLQMALLMNRIEANANVSAEHLQQVAAYADRLKGEISEQTEVVKGAQDAAEAARLNYIEAAKEEESLEKLKERKQDEYKEYIEGENNKFLDELTVQRMGFKRSKE